MLLNIAVTYTAPPAYSAELATAYAQEPNPWVDDNPWVALPVGLVFLLLAVAGTIGLYRFKPWGRQLSLVNTIVGLLLMPLLGVTLSSPLEGLLGELSELSWGAALALAYWSPLSAQFEQSAMVADRASTNA